MKGFAASHLNLDERHGTYAAAMLADAALRVMLLWALLLLVRHHPALLVLVPALAAGVIAGCISGAWRSGRLPISDSLPVGPLLLTHRSFLLPLLLFAFTTWVTGVSDRYFLLQRVGGVATGLYAALYGMFSTPFAILSMTLIQVFRPRLSFHHAIAPEGEAYRTTHSHFLILGIASAVVLAVALWLARSLLLNLMLRPEHAELFPYLPLLLFGQIAFVIGQLMEQGFYIRRRMSPIVIKQSVGACVALGLMTALIPRFGVRGAFLACLGYYTIECLCGAILVFRDSFLTRKEIV
jgi:O-antigen/teichoic acid export membrane protein